jgi:hypothetical protein
MYCAEGGKSARIHDACQEQQIGDGPVDRSYAGQAIIPSKDQGNNRSEHAAITPVILRLLTAVSRRGESLLPKSDLAQEVRRYESSRGLASRTWPTTNGDAQGSF